MKLTDSQQKKFDEFTKGNLCPAVVCVTEDREAIIKTTRKTTKYYGVSVQGRVRRVEWNT